MGARFERIFPCGIVEKRLPTGASFLWRQTGTFLRDFGQMSQYDWFSKWAWRMLGEPVLVMGFALLHYAVLGAASGLVAGVVFRSLRGHRVSQKQDGEVQELPTEL